jgi:hypothetical protein
MAICNSDPFHHRAFSELLVGLGYNGGVPITREFGVAHMDGRSNEQIGRFLFPDWDQDAFFRDKEVSDSSLGARLRAGIAHGCSLDP